MPLTRTSIIVVSIAIIVAIIASGVAVYYAYRASTPAGVKKVKMAFIFPGSVTDTSWNEAAYRSMEIFRGKHPSVEIAWVQGVYDPAQIESQTRSYVKEGYNLIIGVGFQFGPPFAKLAKEYKNRNVYFLAIAGAPNYLGSHVSIADIRTDQSCFITGYLASKLSKTKSLGFTAGMKVAELARCEKGLRAGIKYAGLDPDKALHVFYVGDFHDTVKAKLGTLALIEQYKVDVIKTMGDGAQLGGMAAAKEKKVLVFMTETYHPEIYPTGTAAFSIWHWEIVYEGFYNDYISGKLSKGGQYYWLTMNNGGLKLVYNKGVLPDQLISEAQQLETKIKSGEISTGFKP